MCCKWKAKWMWTEEEKANSIIFFWIVSTFVFSAGLVFFSLHCYCYVDFDGAFFALSLAPLLCCRSQKQQNIMQRWNRKIVTCNLSWEIPRKHILFIFFVFHHSFFFCIFSDLLVHPGSSCRCWCCCGASTGSLAFFTVAFFLPSKLSLIPLFFFPFFSRYVCIFY